MAADRLPRLPPLLLRVAVAAAGILWLADALEKTIVLSAIPAIAASFQWADDDFKVLGIDIGTVGANEVLRFRADYSHPIHIAGRIIYPMNWNPRTAGWLQVNLTMGGILQYGILMLILVVAWPASNLKEFLSRTALSLPLAALLTMVGVVSTLRAELHGTLHSAYAPHEFWPMLAWSRLLMGGGGILLAFIGTAVCIAIAKHGNSGASSPLGAKLNV